MKPESTGSRPDPPRPANWPGLWPHPPNGRATPSTGAMVVSTDRYASRVGLDVLRRGGNAVDATVAVHFALAVVNPEAGNLGGGGFILLRTAGGQVSALDFRSCAPELATPDMFLDAHGNVDGRSTLGALAAGVPGSVRGVWDAHNRYGRLPWSDLVQPSIELAAGFSVTERFVASFEPHIIQGLNHFPASRRVFLPDGRAPRVGDVFAQPDLARTLERIRDQGADGFYRGLTADLIVAMMERGGGVITHDDLANYETVWRTPLECRYRGHTVISMPPPSSGGVALTQIANILDRFSIGDLAWHGPEHVHLLAEAWSRAFADRNQYLCDPAFGEMPLDVLTSRAYADWRAGSIPTGRATPAAQVRPGVSAYEQGRHTTHFSIVDRDGNAASNTTTINTWYGGKAVVDRAGVLLNNDMDDFSVKPGAPNFFGLVQGEENAVAPGKRMLSAMTPTIVLDPGNRLRLVLGAPGGATIITTVFQILSNLLDHGMTLPAAVAAPRVHHQHLPDHIRFEPAGLPESVIRTLTDLGHRVVEHFEMAGDAQTILCGEDGMLHGFADPRRGGQALGE